MIRQMKSLARPLFSAYLLGRIRGTRLAFFLACSAIRRAETVRTPLSKVTL